jgi:glycosyltransferase involved in cell wall biosynthesis
MIWRLWMKERGRKRVLVITPAFSGGSWICIEKILEVLAERDIEIRAIGLGKVFRRNDGFKYLAIPFPRYDRWGFVTSAHPLVAFLWNLPLLFLGTAALFIYKPDMVISNGFSSGLTIGPLSSLLRKKLVIMYHGYIGGYLSGINTRIVIALEKTTDLVVVNSEDSYEDIRSIVPEEKIVINEHYADELFFEEEPRVVGNGSFTILYVGRIDADKLCYPLIQLASDLGGNPAFKFVFVGVGEFANRVREIEKNFGNVMYLGYVEDRKRLRELYLESDLVWSFADENYLALSAVESLACGTPIMVPKIVALPVKTAKNIEVNKKLVPEKIGWLIDPNDRDGIRHTISEIRDRGISSEMRDNCREYARLHHSIENLHSTVERVYSCLYSAPLG